MAKTSPTQRSLEFLRKHGYRAAVVEKFNSFVKRRQDLFGFADIIAVGHNEILLVQTTSASNFASRATKIRESEAARDWIFNGGVIAIHGWKKTKDGRWTARIERARFAPDAANMFKEIKK